MESKTQIKQWVEVERALIIFDEEKIRIKKIRVIKKEWR